MFLERGYSAGVGAPITTSPADITPANIRHKLISTGVPWGIEIISPDDAMARMIENGYDPRSCYAPQNVIELRLKDPYDLCSLTLFLEQVYALLPQENLYKVFGEAHTMSSHIMAQVCAIAAHPGTVLCDEYPVNDLANYAHVIYKLPKSSLDLDALEKADPQGHLYAQALIAKPAFHAPLAVKHRYQAVLNGNGSVALVDVMKKRGGDYLDESDPLVREMVQRRFGDRIDLTRMDLPVHPDTPENDIRGVISRNDIMARRIVSKASNTAAAGTENSAAPVIGTGRAHLGTKIKGISYEDGLPCCILREAKAQGKKNPALVSVFFETTRYSYTAERIIPRGHTAGHIPVIVRNFGEDEHKYGSCLQTQQDCLDLLAASFETAGQTGHPAYQAFKAPVEKDPSEMRNTLRVNLGISKPRALLHKFLQSKFSLG